MRTHPTSLRLISIYYNFVNIPTNNLDIMQVIPVICLLFIVAGFAQAAVNGRCMAGSIPGVCLSTNACKHGGPGGGTPHSENFCPSDPDDIQCCTKTSCGKGGNCRWTNQCAGTPKGKAPPVPYISQRMSYSNRNINLQQTCAQARAISSAAKAHLQSANPV